MSLANQPDRHAKALAPSGGDWDGGERPRRTWRRWGVGLLIIVVPCVLLVAANLGYRRHHSVVALEKALAELDQKEPGWRLADIEAARAVVPDEENSALAIGRAHALLPLRWPPQDLGERFSLPPPQARLDDEDAAWIIYYHFRFEQFELVARNIGWGEDRARDWIRERVELALLDA